MVVGVLVVGWVLLFEWVWWILGRLGHVVGSRGTLVGYPLRLRGVRRVRLYRGSLTRRGPSVSMRVSVLGQ
jgi:hypothetical protein